MLKLVPPINLLLNYKVQWPNTILFKLSRINPHCSRIASYTYLCTFEYVCQWQQRNLSTNTHRNTLYSFNSLTSLLNFTILYTTHLKIYINLGKAKYYVGEAIIDCGDTWPIPTHLLNPYETHNQPSFLVVQCIMTEKN